MDEVIDELLTKDYSCDIALPRIKKRFLFFVFLTALSVTFSLELDLKIPLVYLIL